MGNAERRTQLWRQQVKGQVSLVLTYGKLFEFAKYFKTDEVWGEELLAQMPEYRGKTLYQVLFENGEVNKFKVPTDVPDTSMMKQITLVTTYKKVYSKNTLTSVVVMVMT